MTYEQFWYGDAELYWAYQTVFINKEIEKQEKENNFAWLQGVYIFNALSAALSNSNRTKESDPVQYYLDKPINFNGNKNDMINTEQEKFENRMKAYLVNQKMKIEKKGKK